MRLLLVDDHRLLADALAYLIESQFPALSVQRAHCLREALSSLADQSFELVLLDLSLPDSCGLEAISAVRAQAPTVRIVILSADNRPETIQAAIEMGASGYIPKQADSRQLMQALTAALQGGIPLPALMLARLPEPHEASRVELTPRQTDVLRLLIEGHTNKLICRHLGLSESSVKTHLEDVYRRLGVSSRTQAVVAAARLGMRLNGD